MDNATYQDRLNDVYGGEVIAIEKYLNHKAVIRMHCGKCSTVFWARPDYLIGDSYQRHLCGRGHKGTLVKIASEHIRVKLLLRQQKEIYTLLEKNVSILYISLQLGLNVSTIRWFLEQETKNVLEKTTNNKPRG